MLILISLLGVCVVENTQAQGDILDFDNLVLQMSQTFPGGSARIRGLGGTQTALGGDISSASSNPAGLGFFNRSEFSFTPNFNYISSTGDYLGESTEDTRFNFNFANLGVVINRTKGDLVEGKWRGGNFGISINRIADFQNNITYSGANRSSDFIDFAVDSDNGFNAFGINDLSDLAFNTFLTDEFYVIYNGQTNISINGIDYNVNDLYGNVQNGDSLFFVDRNIYRPDGSLAFPTDNEPTRQTETIKSRGATYKTSFSYGGNYDDRLYFGASIGILTYSQDVSRIYTERPANADLSVLTLEDAFEQNGVGVNATFGVIGRPAAPVLIGLSYTTPSVYAIEQLRVLSLSADYPGFDSEFDEIIYDPFEYTVTTPASLKGGITYFFGKQGFITAEVEQINYDGARLSNADDGFSFSASNNLINRYESVLNYSAGAEFRIDMIRLRAGYAYQGDPVDDNLDQSIQQISLGAGFRTKDYFVDLAVQNRMGNENTITPYPYEQAKIETDRTSVAVSVGWFF